jgi:uncharacterized membrane protein
MWWVLFGGTHIVGSSLPVRTFLIRTLGLRGFKALYSLVAFATLIPLCWVYATDKHAGSFLFEPPGPAMRHVTELLMLLALIVLMQALHTRSPLTTQAEMSGKYGSGARAIQRVTRHPQNLAFIIYGVAHALVNPTVGDWIFFGGFVVYGMLSAIHQDRRVLAAGNEQARRFVAETSALPFAAILAGRQRLVLREFSLVGLIAAVVLLVVLRFFHGSWFGGFG